MCNKMMYVTLFSDLLNESSMYYMLYFISHMCSYQTCPTAKPSTAAVHIQLNLLEGRKGGEMTSRSKQ